MKATIPNAPDWPEDAQTVGTLEDTLEEIIGAADFGVTCPGTVARAVIEELGLDPEGWVLVRALRDRPLYVPSERTDR